MVLPNSNFNPALPIPNNPFYAPETYTVQGAYNNFIVGQNLFVDQIGCLSATPGGPIGTVASIAAGTGLCTNLPGSIPITSVGVLALSNFGPGASTTSYPSSITLDVKGRVQAIVAGIPPVTSVGAGTGLCTNLPGNAAITTTGFISLCALNPNPAGNYTNATVTVNAYGQVTGATSGTSPITTINGTLPIVVAPGANPTVSVNAATSSTCGVVHGCTASTSTALGVGAGNGANFASSGCNVALGAGVNVTSGWTGRQLAIGSPDGNWLEGCSDLSIRPKRGIRDINGYLGCETSVLRSGGDSNNLIVWSQLGATGAKKLTPGSAVRFDPNSSFGLELRLIPGNIGLYISPNPSVTPTIYATWISNIVNGLSGSGYNQTIPIAGAKLIPAAPGLTTGIVQFATITLMDAAFGNATEMYQATLYFEPTGVGSESIISMTKLF